MPFNKGDFTQQGVAGHVNSILRLNEKRYVYIDLTSNEEAEGCTISGAVADPLNNEVYPIGAGVSGNIEITENGENINVAPYATATVNVAGGGDPLGCTVNLTMLYNNPIGGGEYVIDGLVYNQDSGYYNGTASETYSIYAPLLSDGQGGYMAYFMPVVDTDKIGEFSISDRVNLTYVSRPYDANNTMYGLIITDITQPASCNIVYPGPKAV